MDKRALKEDIESIVRLIPRPKLNGKLLPKARNIWMILSEFDDGEGIVLLNTITTHEGRLPYDSLREFRKPDILILRAQVVLGKDGEFGFEVIADIPDQESSDQPMEILPERMNHARIALGQCNPEQVHGLRELLIRQKMTVREMKGFCDANVIRDGYKFFVIVNGLTSFLERDGVEGDYQMWIKPGFVPILSKLLLDSPKETPRSAAAVLLSEQDKSAPSESVSPVS